MEDKMTAKSKIKILIKYKNEGETDWKKKKLLPEEYFDSDLADEFHIKSVPIWMHAVDYLPESEKDITYSELTLVDEISEKKTIIKETLWNEGKNRIIETIDYDLEKILYWEVIYHAVISDTPKILETLRFNRYEGKNVINLHNVRTVNGSGIEIVDYFKPHKERRIL